MGRGQEAGLPPGGVAARRELKCIIGSLLQTLFKARRVEVTFEVVPNDIPAS